MFKFFATIILGVVLVIAAVVAVAYTGIYDIAATAPHTPIMAQALEKARVRSIQAHAKGVEAPPGLDDQSKIAMGAGHFAQHCAVCHGAPGVKRGDIGNGLYPPPPSLATTVKAFTPAELFWIVKHGIKMTGMPAWIDHSDDEIWAVVAFLQKLPRMKQQDYAQLLAASGQAGAAQQGQQGGQQQGSSRQEPPPIPAPPHRGRTHR